MQPHDNDQRTSKSDSDGGRDAKQRATQGSIQLALSQALNMAHGKVHIAEAGKPVNMGASLRGDGGLKA